MNKVPVILRHNHRKFPLKDNGRTDPFLTGRYSKVLPGQKYCPGCRARPKGDFTKNKSTKDGLSVYCRKCNSIMIKSYRNGS